MNINLSLLKRIRKSKRDLKKLRTKLINLKKSVNSRIDINNPQISKKTKIWVLRYNSRILKKIIKVCKLIEKCLKLEKLILCLKS
jgi:hypothetical protein